MQQDGWKEGGGGGGICSSDPQTHWRENRAFVSKAQGEKGNETDVFCLADCFNNPHVANGLLRAGRIFALSGQRSPGEETVLICGRWLQKQMLQKPI